MNQDVFIVALPRSGSTLVGMMLGAHSKICHIGESSYWSIKNVHTSRCCCGKVGCRALIQIHNFISEYPEEIQAISTACGLIDLIEEPNKIRHSLSLFSENFNQSMLPSLMYKCNAGIEKIANSAKLVSGKKIVVENSKYITVGESLLNKEKNTWKLIVVIRDPRAIAFSSKEAGRRKGVPRPVKEKIEIFISFANRVSEIIKKRDVLFIRYEDLCNNTCKTLNLMCAFLGVTYEKRMLEFKKYKGHLLMGNHMMYDSNQKVLEDIRWRDFLNQSEKNLFFRDDIVQAYAQFGYEVNKFY
jgi:hypothetical protein